MNHPVARFNASDFNLARIVPLLLVVACLTLSWASSFILVEQAQQQAISHFRFHVHNLALELNRKIQANEQLLRSTQLLFAADNFPSARDFLHFTEHMELGQGFAGMQALGFIQSQPVRDTTGLWQLGIRLPEGQHGWMYLATFPGRLLPAFEQTHPDSLHQVLQRARDENQMQVSAVLDVRSRQDSERQPGVMLVLPIYRSGMPRDTLLARRASLQAWAVLVVHVDKLMAHAMQHEEFLGVRLEDSAGVGDDGLLYSWGVRAGLAKWQVAEHLPIGRSNWVLTVSGVANTTPPVLEVLPWLGSIASLLLGLVCWLVLHARAHANNITEAMRLANLVYQHSSQGMVVTDPQGRVIHTNPAFTEITGYSAQEVLGKNPRVWSSGRHDVNFYRQMWQNLMTKGSWAGEIWNRRKSGEVFAEWISVSAIRDEQNDLQGFVSLYSDLTEKKLSDELLWRQMNYDPLTSCPNRQMLLDKLQIEVNRCTVNGHGLALMLLDLDQFKYINDALGHHVGDALLVDLAKRIQSCLREQDILARFGGDEFAVVLSPLPEQEQNFEARVAQRILEAIATGFVYQTQTIPISASIGITHFPQDGQDVASLLKNADQAMFKAKHQGRDQFCYFTYEMQLQIQERMRLDRDMRHALPLGQLEVWFQPIVDLRQGQVYKAEALLRWRHPEQGLISPARFIPLAEENGMIHVIGEWVFCEAVRRAERWGALTGRSFQISVNRSPLQFHPQADAQTWIDQLRDRGLPGDTIAVEITEGLMLNAAEHVNAQLTRFVAAGLQISVDDFGTGYSSLAYIKKFHIDFLKIDQSFVREMVKEQGSRVIVETIILMAHKLGIRVIAEGIETVLQLELLQEMGCDFGQGYLLGRPLPASDFEQQVLENPQTSIVVKSPL